MDPGCCICHEPLYADQSDTIVHTKCAKAMTTSDHDLNQKQLAAEFMFEVLTAIKDILAAPIDRGVQFRSISLLTKEAIDKATGK